MPVSWAARTSLLAQTAALGPAPIGRAWRHPSRGPSSRLWPRAPGSRARGSGSKGWCRPRRRRHRCSVPHAEESNMQQSTHRILTTHVGSLARPEALIPLLRRKERGQPYDTEAFARLVREAVADVVRKQVEAGIDIITDGEQGKESFFGYINDRFNGFELRPLPPGEVSNPRTVGREYRAFPDYYAWAERIAASAGGRGGDRSHGVYTCTGPISYKPMVLVSDKPSNNTGILQTKLSH